MVSRCEFQRTAAPFPHPMEGSLLLGGDVSTPREVKNITNQQSVVSVPKRISDLVRKYGNKHVSSLSNQK